jgi:hypothetical protein
LGFAVRRGIYILFVGSDLRQRRVSGLKLLVAALAFIGAAAGWHIPAPYSATGVAQSAEGTGETTSAILTYAGFHTSNAHIGSNPLNLTVTGDGNAPTLRNVMRGGRLPKALGIGRHFDGAAASRARMADLSYLDVATILAYARAGMAAYRSTAPPPASSC